MNLYSDSDILQGALREVGSPPAQKRSLKLLRRHVEIALRELSLDSFAKFEMDLYENVFSLLYNDSIEGKKGGVLAIRELINCPSAIPDAKTAKFSNVLSIALDTNTHFELLISIAEVIGYIAKYTPVPLVDFIEAELSRALEWLEGTVPYQRLAACAVLEQLAKNTPTLFFVQCKAFFDVIWSPLRDSKERIRLSAAQALSACMRDLDKRTYHLQWYCSLYEQVLLGYKDGSLEAVHGSLLVTEELLKYTGDFMLPRYKEVCIAVLSMREHKSKIIRSSLIQLYPRLSAYCPEAYARFYLDVTIDMLIKCAKTGGDDIKAVSMRTIGKLCKSMGVHLSERVEELLELVRGALVCAPSSSNCKRELVSSNQQTDNRNPRRNQIPPEALSCVADMVCGLDESFHYQVLGLLDCMLQSGLTTDLIDALAVIADNMPAHKELIHQKLLGEIMFVLSGVTYGPRSTTQAIALQGESSKAPAIEEGGVLWTWWRYLVSDYESLSRLLSGAGPAQSTLDQQQQQLQHQQQLAMAYSSRDYSFTHSRNRGSRSGRGKESGSCSGRGPLGQYKAKGREGGNVYRRKGFAPWVDPETTFPEDLPKMNILPHGNDTGTGSGDRGNDHFLSSPVPLLPPNPSFSSPTKASMLSGAVLGAEGKREEGGERGEYWNDDRHLLSLINYDPDLVLLAMRTLQLLSTPSSGVLLLVHRHILPFLSAPEEPVREEAASTAATLLSPIAKNRSLSLRGPSADALNTVLTRLLEVCVTDSSAHVRQKVLKSIKLSFDRHLLQEQRIATLFFLVSDECFEIRIAAIELLGSLADKNSAVVLSSMRQVLKNLISQLQHGTADRIKEEAALTICVFLRAPSLHRLVKPFMVTLIHVLPIDCDVRLTMAGMEALGELCVVMKTNMLEHLSKLLPVIILNILDGSSQRKQEISVRTLGQLVSASGLVVTPYLEYPQLLPLMLELLSNSAVTDWSLRSEILRTLGLIGALDPTKYLHIEGQLGSIKRPEQTVSSEFLTTIRRTGVSELYLGQEAVKMANMGIHYKITDLRAKSVTLRLKDGSSSGSSSGSGGRDGSNGDGGSSNSSSGAGSGSGSKSARNSNTSNGNNGKLALVPKEECGSAQGSAMLNAIHTEVLVRAAVNIHGVDADLPAHELLYELSVMRAQSFPTTVAVPTITPSHEEYYPRVALTALMKILHDSTLHLHHPSVTQAITVIFQSLGMQCVRYLDKVLPYFLQIIRKCSPGLRESLLYQISQICVYVQYHLAPYIHEIFGVITDLWTDHIGHVLTLAESLNQYAYDEFSPYIPRLLKLILSDIKLTPCHAYLLATPPSSTDGTVSSSGTAVDGSLPLQSSAAVFSSDTPPSSPPSPPPSSSSLHTDDFTMKSMVRKLQCLCKLRNILRPHINLVMSTLCKFISLLIDDCEVTVDVRSYSGQTRAQKETQVQTLIQSHSKKFALSSQTLLRISNACYLLSLTVRTMHVVAIEKVLVDFPTIAGRAVHTLVRALRSISAIVTVLPFLPAKTFTNLFSDCNNFFCVLAVQLGGSFLVLDRSIQECYSVCNVQSTNYDETIAAIVDGNVRKLELSRSTLVVDNEHEDDILFHPERLRAGVQCGAEGARGMGHIGSGTGVDIGLGLGLGLSAAWRGAGQAGGGGGFNNNNTSSSSMQSQKMLISNPTTKHNVNQLQLQKAWNTNQRYQTADWHAWFKSVLVEMLRESPSPFLQACSSLAQAYLPLARELFQAAFVSCWTELSDVYQDHIIRSMHIVFYSPTVPPDILLVMLNLAEFMEHDVEALPIEPKVLAELAEKSHAYAKALHYRELEFQSFPAISSNCFHRLIHINKKLNNHDGAYGILKLAQTIQSTRPELGIVVKEAWLAKLGRWDEALNIYEKKLEIHPTNAEALVGKSKCLNALGRWEDALELLLSNPNLSKKSQNTPVLRSTAHKAAVIGARAAWSLNRWEVMDSFVQKLPPGNIDATFMSAVLAVHEGNFEKSDACIDKTRKFLNQNMTGLLAESYNRAYVDFVMNQQLGELEEIQDHKKMLRKAGLGLRATSSNDLLFGSNGNNHSRSASASDLELLSSGGYKSTGNVHMANIPSFSSLAGIGSMSGDGGDTPGDKRKERGTHLSSSAKGLLMAEANEHKAFLIEKWKKRIRGCLSSGRAAITHWQNLLNLRKMLVGQREDIETWLQFVTICRHGGYLALSQRALGLRIGEDPSEGSHTSHSPSSPFNPNFMMDAQSVSIDYRIEFEKLRLQWSLGHKEYACRQLETAVCQLHDYTAAKAGAGGGSVGVGGSSGEAHVAKVHLECLLKLGDWKLRLLGPGAVITLRARLEVLHLYQQATLVDPLSYRAWHQWGLSAWHAALASQDKATTASSQHSSTSAATTRSNGVGNTSNSFRSSINLSTFGQRPSRRSSLTTTPRYDSNIEGYVIHALKGLFHAMSLASGKHCASVMQDMVCILNFWFKFGEHANVSDVLREGLRTVPLDCWLGVLPQLIARIHHVGDVGRALLHDLLSRLGTHHAQALMYPLSVALQSPREDRQRAAQMLLMNLRQHSSQLIDQSVLVSQELIRIAILWDEEWYATIEDASRVYYGEGNYQKMLDLLLPLHDKMAMGSKTNTEAAFLQAYGSELKEAHGLLTAYVRLMAANNTPIPVGQSGGESSSKKHSMTSTVEQSYLTKAWDLYTMIIRRIHPTLKQITSHNLINVSPQLVTAQHLDLAIPGTYTLRGESVRIRGFRQHLSIILSKQRPRKIYLMGANGLEYVFLLKGHEDLRQDERAMQLFGLVNALLKHDRRTDSHDLDIHRYAVVPLSPDVGLSGWVPKCDTLHDLIRNYRDRKKILLDIEHRLMEQLVHLKGGHDKLTAIQKLEIFEHSLKNTNGKDLHKILWFQSTSSESWIIRREAYTKSLAVMSVVGYVLGLGDRHPSNLMLERESCKILHIDFGDCFEVAMHRDKFPEKIPFRLTRMLVLAMEISGVEGLFRLTCERVMKVMRENCDSLVAILEAFVHDPLLSWRLLNPNRDKASRGPEASKAARKIHNKNSSSGIDGVSNNNATAPSSKNPTPPLPQKKNTIQTQSQTPSQSLSVRQQSEQQPSQLQQSQQRNMSDLELEHSRSNSSACGVGSNAGSNALGISFATKKPISSSSTSLVVSSSLLSRSLLTSPLPPIPPTPPTFQEEQEDGTLTPAYRFASSITTRSAKQGAKTSKTASRSRSDSSQLLQSSKYKGDIARMIADEEEDVEEEDVEEGMVAVAKDSRDSVDGNGNGGGNGNGVAVRTRLGHLFASPSASSIATATPPPPPPYLSRTETNSSSNSISGLSESSVGDGGRNGGVMESSTIMAFTSRSHRSSRTLSLAEAEGQNLTSQEELTDKAVTVVQRVLDKLTGLDFQENRKNLTTTSSDATTQNINNKALEIPEQVDLLIKQATSNENLSTCFIGWCAFW